MKSFKKSIVFLMVAALVFGTVAPAFAATPVDVAGTSYEDAVGKMVALGIINGYDDGTFQPEKAITRAEFAKIACYVVGQQNAANLSKGSATKFSDVPSTHWASGFVSVASSQGLLKGYPNGTFKPEANVSYAEAITILVRALGMAPVVEGKGTWPANYMAKASEIGMFNDVTGLVGTDNAVRGNIAKLAWNTLDANKWGPRSYDDKGEITYGDLSKSLLSYGYKDFADSDGAVKLYTDEVIESTRIVNSNLNDKQVSFTNDLTETNLDTLTGTTAGVTNNVFDVVDGLDLSNFIGCKVDVLLGKDNKVAFVKSQDTVVNGKLTEVKDGTPDKVTVAGKEYDVDSTLVNTIVNYGKTASAAIDSTLDTLAKTTTVNARLVVDKDSNKVTAMSIVAPGLITNVAGDNGSRAPFIVKEVKSASGVVDGVDATNKFDLDLLTDGNTTSKVETIFVKNGKLATRNDIKVGDIVVKMGDYVFVTDNKVTGKVSAVSKDYKLTVNGVEYKMATGARVTTDGKIENAESAVGNSKVTDLLGKDVTLSLNVNGDYALINGNTVSNANYQYGVLSGAPSQVAITDAAYDKVYMMEIVTSEGVKRTLYAKGKTDKFTTVAGLAKGDFIEYQVRADGSIDPEKVTEIAAAGATNTDKLTAVDFSAVDPVAGDVNHDAKSIKADVTLPDLSVVTKTFYFSTTGTVVFNAHLDADGLGADVDKIEKVANWDAISDSAAGNSKLGTATFALVDDTNVIKYLVVNTATYADSSENQFAAVTAPVQFAKNSDDETVLTIGLLVDGTPKTFEILDSIHNVGTGSTDATIALDAQLKDIEVGDVIEYSLDGDGEIDAVLDLDKDATADATDFTYFTDKSEIVKNTNNDYDQYFVKANDERLVSFKNDKNDVATPAIRLDQDVKVIDATGTTPVAATVSDIKADTMIVAYDNEEDYSTSAVEGDGLYDVVVILSK